MKAILLDKYIYIEPLDSIIKCDDSSDLQTKILKGLRKLNCSENVEKNSNAIMDKQTFEYRML